MSCRIKTLNRVHEMNNFLLKNVKTVFRLRKIGVSLFERKTVYAYTVSLQKDYKNTLEEMIETFYKACKKMVNGNEMLKTSGKSFKVISDDYEVFYYVEAWKKSADKIGYIEGGAVKTEFIHRMSCEQAAYIFKKHNVDPLEFLQGHDNHADKYVEFAKLLQSESELKNLP